VRGLYGALCQAAKTLFDGKEGLIFFSTCVLTVVKNDGSVLHMAIIT
jgi:hypothetical protein